MPSEYCLPFEALMLPIAGDDGSGDARIYTRLLRDRFAELRKDEYELDPQNDHPMLAKRADWNAVVAFAEKSLVEQSKDLRTVCHYIEGLTRLYRFCGLSQGLQYLQQLLDQAWDRLNPPLEGNQGENCDARLAPIANLLNDPDRGPCFPNIVRAVPLFGDDDAACNVLNWNRARAQGDASTRDQILRQASATPRTVLETTAAHINESLETLQRIDRRLDALAGADAPGLTQLRAALIDCRGLVFEELARRGPLPAARGETTQSISPNGATQTSPNRLTRLTPAEIEPARHTRDELYAQLDYVAELLEQLEPHSPAPYLVKRAVQLGRLPFPSLMQEVIREQNMLTELNREFGIQRVVAK